MARKQVTPRRRRAGKHAGVKARHHKVHATRERVAARHPNILALKKAKTWRPGR